MYTRDKKSPEEYTSFSKQWLPMGDRRDLDFLFVGRSGKRAWALFVTFEILKGECVHVLLP